MKKAVRVLYLFLIVYVVYVLYTTGFFRTIENQFSGEVLRSIPIAGVEDITVDSEAGFAVFIAYDRAAERAGQSVEGQVYYLDLREEPFEAVPLLQNFDRPFLPHGISLISVDSSRHRLFVVNHDGGEYIEVFDLFHGDSLVHRKSLEDELIYAPNDIVATGPETFYFTNDTYFGNTVGKYLENYLGLQLCETVFYDGSAYRVVASDHSYANGINYDPARELLYVAGVRDFSIKVYRCQENGGLQFLETIDCGTGVDNIEIDPDGTVWVGCHPNMIAVDRYLKGKADQSPSEIIRIDYRKLNDYDLETIYLNDGNELSASTVAAPYRNLLLVGSVSDDHFLILKRGE
jgi:arylesterase/paraoxonase